MILHGLFGFSDNWQTHAKKLAEYYRVILVDLRNHGHSDWDNEFSYEIMADDVKELVDDLQLSELILVGHSMGGKVAINFAQKHEELLEKLVIVDMGTKGYAMHHDHILKGIHSVKLEDCLKPQFQRTVESSFKSAEPFMRFLCKAVGVRF